MTRNCKRIRGIFQRGFLSQRTVKCFVWERNSLCLIFFVTAVAPSPDSFDQCRIFRIVLNLPAQIPDMHHNDVVRPIVIWFVPDRFIKVLCGENLSRMHQKQEQNGIFRVRQFHRDTVFGNFLCAFIQCKLMICDFGMLCRLVRFSLINLVSADQCLGAAHQFCVGKWFCQIVIAAAGKTEGFVTFLCAGT